jgi:hypothetical protein
MTTILLQLDKNHARVSNIHVPYGKDTGIGRNKCLPSGSLYGCELKGDFPLVEHQGQVETCCLNPEGEKTFCSRIPKHNKFEGYLENIYDSFANDNTPGSVSRMADNPLGVTPSKPVTFGQDFAVLQSNIVLSSKVLTAIKETIKPVIEYAHEQSLDLQDVFRPTAPKEDVVSAFFDISDIENEVTGVDMLSTDNDNVA